ncbi:MAG: NAD(P)-binding domain-containing protein [Gemmobacter sp.]|nr:NAD(P)-binding domain-containing protein [Gemmobacter sp.]
MPDTPPSAPWAIIGAGPMGIATAKVFYGLGLPFVGFDLNSDVGGLWDIDAPRSTMYDSAHLISSRTKTQFTDFPMAEDVPDYPSHKRVLAYFRDYADHFDLRRHYHFGAEVLSCVPDDTGWTLRWRKDGADHTGRFRGVLICNGTLSEPNMPVFPGHFDGALIHSSKYRSPSQFTGKRVLVVGAGNSGCDIAVDAIHHAVSCDLSMRRGYHFVPKYVFGRPADTIGGAIRLPMWLKRRVDGLILSWFVGDAQKLGFPKPDHQLYESHPVVNSQVLFHAGHGDLRVRPDITRLDGNTVCFKDGTSGDYDMILAATGYRLHYPFIDQSLLNWQGDAPHLYLNCMHPDRDDLFVMGMIEATGLGWQGRHDQAELVGRYIQRLDSPGAATIRQQKSRGFRRATGGMRYLNLPRMAYYVDKTTYLRTLHRAIRKLGGVA